VFSKRELSHGYTGELGEESKHELCTSYSKLIFMSDE
jgi:hypothetical protein